MSHSVKAYLGATLYVLIFGFAFLFLKVALGYAQPLNLLGHRFMISFLSLLVLKAVGVVKFKLTWREFKEIAPLAFFYPVVFSLLQAYGMRYVSSSETGIIQALSPIFTMMIGSVLIGEKSSFLQKIFICLSVFGVIYIFYHKGVSFHENTGMGLFLITISVLAFSMSHVLVRRMAGRHEPMKISFVMVGIAALVFNLFAVIDMGRSGNLGEYFSAFSNLNYVGCIFYLGFFASLITSFLTNYVLSKIDAFKNSVFINLGTLLTIINGILFLNEEFDIYHIIGSVMIIIGVIGVNLKPHY